MHSLIIAMIESETNKYMLIQELKLLSTILTVTPYARMMPGLPLVVLNFLLGQFNSKLV